MHRVHLLIKGRVQGVFFRHNATLQARQRGLKGWVRNTWEGHVEIVAEGPREALESFINWCHEGPPSARVDEVEVEWEEATGGFEDFSIHY